MWKYQKQNLGAEMFPVIFQRDAVMFAHPGEILIMHLTSERCLKWLSDKPFKH